VDDRSARDPRDPRARGSKETKKIAFDFDTPVDRTGTASHKWGKYESRDVIPLWVADMDFRSAPAIVEALRQRASHGVFGYTDPPADLVREVRTSLLEEYGWEVDADWIVWLPGLVTGLNVLCRAVGAPGDEVATFTPVYPPFMSAPAFADRRTVKVPLVLRDGRWKPDLDSLTAALTPRTKLLLLCSPHNPVARVWSRDELSAIAEIARRHDLTVGSDEVHAGLVLDEHRRHLPFATMSADAARRTVTLMAPSKTFNTPGLGCSFAIVSEAKLRAAVCRAAAGIVPHVNLFGYVAAQAAYEKGMPWRLALLSYLRANRDLVEREVAEMSGLAITHVEATYLAWIDARRLGVADPVRFFEDAGVGLSDGCDFGSAGFLRLNFGCSRTLLVEALRRMREVTDRWAKRPTGEAPTG
jgi:cysteine-S-conjugate beta-lyase